MGFCEQKPGGNHYRLAWMISSCNCGVKFVPDGQVENSSGKTGSCNHHHTLLLINDT